MRPNVLRRGDEEPAEREPSVLESARSSWTFFPFSSLRTSGARSVKAHGGSRTREQEPVRDAARRTPQQPRTPRPSTRALRPTCEDDRLGDRPRTSVDGGSQQAAAAARLAADQMRGGHTCAVRLCAGSAQSTTSLADGELTALQK